MKLLITADGHLNEGEPERLETFIRLVKQGIGEEIDALLVAGDLFHSNSAFRSLKSEINSRIEELDPDFKVLIVPGNHDDKLSSSNFLGENFVVLDEENRRRVISGHGEEIEVVGLPFREGAGTAETLKRLPEPSGSGNSLLLTHGSLIDASGGYAFPEPGEEVEEKKHLIFREDLEKTNYDLVVLGHWHGTRLLEGRNGYLLYPGSFIPVSRREKGVKSYWTLETTEEGPVDLQEHPVQFDSAWYFREERLFFVPGHASDPQGDLRELLADMEADDRCRLKVVIDGFLPEEAELRFRNELLDVSEDFEDQFREITLDWQVTGTDKIDTPLVSKFIENVEGMDKSEVEPTDFLEGEESRLREFFRETIEKDFETVKREILNKSLQIFSERLS